MGIHKSYYECKDKYTGVAGLLCQEDRDQGDTCQREGLLITLLATHGDIRFVSREYNIALERYYTALLQLKVRTGVYHRNNDPECWGSNPNNLSRDQRAMLELAMASVGDKQELREAAWYIIKRGGFHQNTHPGTDAPPDKWKIPDFVSPGELGVYIRGLNLWMLYPLLTILDIGLVLDIKFRKKWDGANMSAINIMYANKKFPTIFSKLAKKLCPVEEYKKEILNYYNASNNGIPPLGDIYVQTMDLNFR